MKLSLQTFSSLVQNTAAAVQGAATQLVDLSVGSVLRAVLEANASLALWLQWLVLLVLNTTRAATSQGADLDTWMADFALVRLPASPAAGTVTFARYVATSAALVPVGALVKTADGTQTFTVVAATGEAAYVAAQNGYTMAPGTTSVSVPVQALVAGSAGNVQAGTVSLLASAIPGIDTVSNPAALSGGADAESDAAFRARFVNYINSRSQATRAAVGYAIASLRQGLSYAIAENVDAAGNARPGSFVVTVNDGTGAPSPALIGEVSAAVDAVRPLGSVYAVQPPQLANAAIALTLSVAAEANRSQVVAAVSAAIGGFVASLPIGAVLPLSRIAQLGYDASPAVLNVTGLAINGRAADLDPGPAGVVVATGITIS